MALDGYFLHKIKLEIEQSTLGMKVDKIHQPSREELVLVLRGRSGMRRLLLSVRADSARVQLLTQATDNPATPPMLCMLLRKHLCGATLTAVRQQELDRVLLLEFSGTNEIGDRTSRTLCCELMGKHSNIILLDENGTVIDALKRVDVSTSSYRQILPGMHYISPPQQEKLNPLTCQPVTLCDVILQCKEKLLSSAVLSCIQGVSPFLSREIVARVGEDCRVIELDGVQKQRLLAAFEQLQRDADTLTVYTAADADGKPLDFCAVEICQYAQTACVRRFEGTGALLEDFYGEKTRYERIKNRGRELFRLVNNLCEKTAHRLANQQRELAACADREQYRLWAELINANLYRLSKGAFFYDVENYYDDNKPIRIPCDPALTPQQQSQRYYKEYRKLQTAERMLTDLIERGQQEAAYLDSVQDELSRSETENDLSAIRQELTREGYITSHRSGKTGGNTSRNSKNEKIGEPMQFLSPDGFTVLIGRNNMQNDRLSLKTAKKDDMFLHTQKIPGSHVIIVRDGREIPPSTMEYAAALAAWFSKARQSALVPVDYTLAGNLKKPTGAPPGKVIYHVYSTIIIDPLKPE